MEGGSYKCKQYGLDVKIGEENKQAWEESEEASQSYLALKDSSVMKRLAEKEVTIGYFPDETVNFT